jgi:multidrug resistance efflux pump
MYLRTLRPPALPGPPPRRRWFPWSRVLLVVAICSIIAYIFLPRYFTLSADGLIEGDLIPVSPLFTSRISERLVQCNQNVAHGQPLAIVSNFILEGQYTQDYQKALEDLRTQQIAQNEGLSQAQIDEASAYQRYESAMYQARKLETVKNAYEETYHDGAIDRVAYESALADWQAAAADANSLREVWQQAAVRVRRVQADNAARIAGAQSQANEAAGLAEQVRSQTLSAPVSGTLVECTAQPGAVVDSGAPIYKIFAPDRAYIIAFFDPNAIAKLHVGETAAITIPGFPQQIDAKVVGVLPSLSKLPDQLTRYFWQHQQWTEYRPVKLVITHLDASLRSQLTYDAQVQVKIEQHGLPMSIASLKSKVGMR